MFQVAHRKWNQEEENLRHDVIWRRTDALKMADEVEQVGSLLNYDVISQSGV